VLAPEEAAPAADGGGAEGAAAGKDGVSLEALRAAAAAKVVAATDTAKGAALQSRGVRDALGWVSATLKRAAAASGSGSGSGAGGAGSAASGAQDDTSSGGPEDERTAAERAAAEGKLLDAPLYAPGRVYWLVRRCLILLVSCFGIEEAPAARSMPLSEVAGVRLRPLQPAAGPADGSAVLRRAPLTLLAPPPPPQRPIDESLPEEQHSFELVDTGCGEGGPQGPSQGHFCLPIRRGGPRLG
jgi:hypothetical protein